MKEKISKLIRKKLRSSLGQTRAEQIKRAVAIARNPSSLSTIAGNWVHDAWRLEKYSIQGCETFFGYYDKRQLSQEGNRLLAGSVSSAYANETEPKTEMQLGWFDVEDKSFHKLGSTAAFNWQQGCMLRWVPNSNDTLIMYNEFKSRRFCTAIVDASSGEKLEEKPYPYYHISSDGRLIATCDFSRLHKCRLGYGYWQQAVNATQDPPASVETNLVELHDVHSNKLIGAVTLNDLSNAISKSISPQDVYLNHLTFSPDSKILLFLAYWKEDGQRKAATLLYRLETSALSVLTRRYMSHFCWKDESTIVAWSEGDHGLQSYHEFDANNKQQKTFWNAEGLTDGHCSIVENDTLLTDTYPNSKGIQTLMIRSDDGIVTEIARLHSPARFSFSLRCDLHPRATTLKDTFTFDAASGGYRSTYLISRK